APGVGARNEAIESPRCCPRAARLPVGSRASRVLEQLCIVRVGRWNGAPRRLDGGSSGGERAAAGGSGGRGRLERWSGGGCRRRCRLVPNGERAAGRQACSLHAALPIYAPGVGARNEAIESP